MRQRTRAGFDLTEPTTSPRQRLPCRGSTAAAMPKLCGDAPSLAMDPAVEPRGDRGEGKTAG